MQDKLELLYRLVELVLRDKLDAEIAVGDQIMRRTCQGVADRASRRCAE